MNSMPRDSAVAMEEVADDSRMATANQIPVRGKKAPIVMTISNEKIDCSPIYDTYLGCDNDKVLFLSPYGLHKDLDLQRNSFHMSGLKFMSDLMDVDKIFEENNWIKFRFFENKDSDFWKTTRHNDIQVKAYKESIFRTTEAIASHSQMEVSEYLSMGKRSWMLFSTWKPLGDPDLCIQEGRMIHYAIRNGKPEDFKDMSEAQLLLACQRENPFWYKLHPSPDLRTDRDVDIEDWSPRMLNGGAGMSED